MNSGRSPMPVRKVVAPLRPTAVLQAPHPSCPSPGMITRLASSEIALTTRGVPESQVAPAIRPPEGDPARGVSLTWWTGPPTERVACLQHNGGSEPTIESMP